ncbi:cupredoxin domain-containing protein [Streptomyces virginiae]|uniref:cupredoxin domain-containing protein n=1 Tax=Streptomyces virginiae TaxID=1961 RepID=UPI002254C4A9|nr:cupredoxin domain-containing protein [Streptomyces virginiae]MCX5275380.1 cupredoxin domain-containing protein [Streptomyces virginiae]
MSLTSPWRGRSALVGAACVLLALAGCSNGSNGYGTAPAPTSAASTASSAVPGAVRIVIENFTFSPADLQVRPGAKVTVVNRDSASHTVTATGDKPFDTGTISGGATATFTAPSTPGSYSYLCTIHPNMKGTLTVT